MSQNHRKLFIKYGTHKQHLLEHYWNHVSEISPISMLLETYCCLVICVYR